MIHPSLKFYRWLLMQLICSRFNDRLPLYGIIHRQISVSNRK
ncbi:hypothetical protein SynROS8604_00188 [Synechococcus sp. ROS8604]|nr:hypothetical protein SynROS8604_00188 [Synechococcus sp. ROS8604]